jgi:hypothetical protein
VVTAGASGDTLGGDEGVRGRVAMTAAKLVLEPIFEARFRPQSFGFRPRRSSHDALEVVRVAANRGAVWVLDADIAACFDECDGRHRRSDAARIWSIMTHNGTGTHMRASASWLARRAHV